jgi:hypothetical protein
MDKDELEVRKALAGLRKALAGVKVENIMHTFL